jgi:hypothetical protein
MSTSKQLILSLVGLGTGMACMFLPGTGAAQPPAEDADPFFNAYSAVFGRGRYTLSDGTAAEVYRANFSKKLRDSRADGGDGLGLRLLLPVTVGTQALADDDLPAGRDERRVEQASFLPGVELEFAPGERWTLRTRAQLGASRETAGDEPSSRIAAVGVRSRYTFADAKLAPALIGGLLSTSFDPDTGERRSLVRATVGLELAIPAAAWQVRGQPMTWSPHLLWDGYYRPSALSAAGSDYTRVDSEWQIGVAARRDTGFKFLFVRFDAVGVAYRFSEHSEGLRIYLNSVF